MPLHPARLSVLREAEERPGAYVLYWMQQSQRAASNPALEHAVAEANRLGLPVLACFGLTDGYPEANARHYAFMLEGLAEAAAALRRRGIGFAIRRGSPDEVALAFAADAALMVCDRGYLRPGKAWRRTVAERAPCRAVMVEGDVVVPLGAASGKHEVGARTLRPKLERVREEYLAPVETVRLRHRFGEEPGSDFDLSDVGRLVGRLTVDHAVAPVRRFKGGYGAARGILDRFLAGPFAGYANDRNLPEAGAASHMSPYLHFGQISPVEIALAARGAGGEDDRVAYLEELIVRRELAMNHAFYQEAYDRYEAVPEWARRSLDEHRGDTREHVYTRDEFEAGQTHDRYWNAGMQEMRETGYMHNHMRMYWGKKIIEWSKTPEEAFETTLWLNNRHFLDGRDANSYTNVAWLFGLHDRPWFKRPVFGNVRYMGQATLKKFDADGYVKEVGRLAAAEQD